jgi:predicted secreted protein
MGWVTGIIVYLLVWWVTLFAVLPLWVAPSEPDDPGHASGAPQQPRMLLKAAITTVVSAIIWVGIYLLVSSPWLSFRDP